MKNIVIVGGGTAGWITALEARDVFKDSSITLIESSEIGILGAGEGTTPNFLNFLESKKISLSSVVKNTKATLKNGIKFTNWNGDGKSYFHPFSDTVPYHPSVMQALFEVYKGKNCDDIVLTSFLSDQNKTKAFFTRSLDDFKLIEFDGSLGIHFDARLMATFLKEKGKQRGINVIDGSVIQINTDEQGFISSLDLEDGRRVLTDFVFDCSGFRRLIIGNFYKSQWKSYSDSIPNNRAMPFFIENKGKTPPFTEAIAMKYGWVWKIPVQGRFGCGYVFDKNLVSDEEIKKEIYDNFGEVDIPRVFNFEAGCYRETWIKNCVSIGLSSGFIEPLEATSIWTQIISLNIFHRCLQGVYSSDPKVIEYYNSTVFEVNEKILAFIYLHYITDRKDTSYWGDFRTKNSPPNNYVEYETKSKQFLEFSSNHLIKPFNELFSYMSIIAVSAGINFFERPLVRKFVECKELADRSFLENLNRSNSLLKRDIEGLSLKYPDHDDLIKKLIEHENRISLSSLG
jgi:tryptophan halogenase